MQCFGGQDGRPLKRIEVVVNVDSFLEKVLVDQQGVGSHVCLVTSDGTYIARSDKGMDGITKLGDSGEHLDRELLKEIKDKRDGFLSGDGHPPEWVIGFTSVRSTDWYLVSYSKGSVVFAPFVRFRIIYTLAEIAVAIIIAFLIHWNTRSVAQSVAEISQAATRVAHGDFNAKVPVDRSDEIGRLTQAFNGMVDDLRQRELIEGMFGRYVDRGVAQELMKRPELFNLGGVEHVVTIMFADLRGFTPVAEKLPPDRVIKMLNRYYSQMIAVVDKYRGVIVDFYGDALLAFFDGLVEDTATRAYDAVNAALEMQSAHRQASKDNERDGLPALKMGIGIHTGEVIIGNIGSETRAKYGIVGSAVNETHRIQQEASGGEILISQQTHEVLADRLVLGTITKVTLKGLEGDRTLYHVKGINDET